MRFHALSPFIALLVLVACGDSDNPPSTDQASTAGERDGELAEVLHVVDGDTIDVSLNGGEERVRYIGVDSPESGACFSNEATAANTDLVAGKVVLLQPDPDGERDRFGRLLRYVYVGDIFVNAELARLGVAEATTQFPERLHREELLAAELEAFSAGAGVWKACPGFGEPPA